MKPERWQRVEQIYNSVLECTPEQREAYLEEACAGDDSLRKEIDSLIACKSDADGFIESPALEEAARDLAHDHSRDASAALSGRTISHYRILEKLGQGGMGIVYKAHDSRLNRPVALKVLPPDKVSDPERKRRFVKEARAASALSHPNIVTIYDIDQADGMDFIAMEYVPGKSLHEAIPRSGLPSGQAIKIGIQVAEGLGKAHAAGIIHRDLKPSNIMVTSDGLVKILDFGLAKLTERQSPPGQESGPPESMSAKTEKGTIAGTAAYMSPEQAEGRPVDARSDIFAFGSVLYEMITGRRAFQGDSFPSTLAAVLKEDPKPPSQIAKNLPAGLERAIHRCLSKDPARRWQHIEDVKVELEELKDESDSGRLPSGAPTVSKRRRWLLPVALATVVTLVAGAVWVWRVMRPQPAATGPSSQGPVLTRLTSDSGLTTEPALSPDGKLLVYASDRSREGNLDLWLQQIPGGQPIRLTKDKADAREPSFSPDGLKIAYSSDRDGGGIYMIPALGGGDARKVAGKGRNPQFSPDGTRIVYWSGIRGGPLLPMSSYVVPAAGGTSEILAPAFTHTFLPSWSLDGKWIQLSNIPPPPSRAGGVWFIPAGGGDPVQLKTPSTPPKTKIAIALFRPYQWLGDRFLFSAKLGDSINLWEVSVSPQPWQIVGEPKRLTFGAGEDLNPCLAGGRLVFSTVNTNLDIWSLPLDAAQGKVLGGLKRLTRDAAVDHSPCISADGKKLIFWSTRGGRGENWIIDLETQKETLLIGTARASAAWLSPDGTKAVFGAPSKEGARKIHILDLGTNVEKEIDAAPQVGPWDFSTTRNKILTSAQAQPRGLIAVDAASGAQSICVRTSRHDLYNSHFSPDSNWIVFIAVEGLKPQAPLFIAPYREGNPPEEKEWIAVTDDSTFNDNPRWSPDGGMIYFSSNRDGYRCIWAQRVDLKTRKPVGSPIAIYHFHEARLLMQEKGGDPLQISVARDKIVFNLREATGNIWMTTVP